ncbi:MAG TPA: sigma-54 dependent transcriptional regulator [Candidatus Hydrogenedentes bacterium]|jgi:DNA-binding NtrC family response regulator|nr:sigma-54-dependent Fis family transcriptional regulator [Candidatus Hydrogenedentota bacterium]OQB43553.1 MAG: Transcriptional regulatory protein ZraR [Candidatus Hydrogenedentes bacterium ADurb.Bin179]HOC68245.1 sigma-54 dependent transcriptional regulator [Candidatus Hydrogenedentota bacterium]
MTNNKGKGTILVVDDAETTCEVLQRSLSGEGYQVATASHVAAALYYLEQANVDLVITDLKMPGGSGMDLVRHVRENLRNTEVMMITGYPSIEGAVQAIKDGAEEYLAKPFTDAELYAAVRRAMDKVRLQRSHGVYWMQTPTLPHGMIGESGAMLKIFDAIGRAASTSATVLISGESGTGKELAARAVHYGSVRSQSPFVPINCGGIPDSLLESELFGHVKGAFTGATESRAGFFHAAEGGTIFLDEISETSASMQVKLLRVLQEKEICMVGSNRARKVDVRILAATNKDLAALMKKNMFRKDLFYRLNVLTIAMPALRERGDDILLLASHFINRYTSEFNRPQTRFSEDALRVLRNYDWPGNVRELENVIQRLILMTEHELIDVPDLPKLMRFSAPGKMPLNRSLAEVEADYIRSILVSVGGNKTRAAEILGIDRKTLRAKLADSHPGSPSQDNAPMV